MPSLKDLRNSFKFQRQAKAAQKELKNIHIEAESSGVKVVVTAGMEPVSMTIEESVPRDQIAPRSIDAFSRALKKAQVVSADKMQGVMGELGIGG